MHEFATLFWGVAILYGLTVFVRPWVRKRAHTFPGLTPIPPDPRDRLRGLAVMTIAVLALFLTDRFAPRIGPEFPGIVVIAIILPLMFWGGIREYFAEKKWESITAVDISIAHDTKAVENYYRSHAVEIQKLDKAKRRYILMVLSLFWLGIPYLGLVLIPAIFHTDLVSSLIITAVAGIVTAIQFADEV